MFEFSAPLFYYRLVFLAELMLAEGLATYTLAKRKRFFLRVLFCVLAVAALTFLLPCFPGNAVYTSLMFLIQFAFTIAALYACYDEPLLNIIFCAVIAYTTQHIAFEIYNQTVTLSGLGNVSFAYGAEESGGNYNVFTALIYAGVYFFTYWLIWAFVERRIRLQDDLRLDHIHLFMFVAVIVTVNIVLSVVVTYLPYGEGTEALHFIVGIYNVLSCVLAMGIQFSMLGKHLAEKELETVQGLWEQDKKAYELSKENIELINVKCHDLRKQLRALRMTGGEVDKAALAEIEHTVKIYDGAVKTGCDVLDVILAEKSLFCESHDIRLTCIADGARLAFMSPHDQYSLFMNAVDNAVEAVRDVPDKDKRIIRLRIAAVGDLLSVHMENYCDNAGDLVFVDGLPRTTKGDSRWHGYGLRSMRLIAEKYGGELTASVEDGMFHMDIVLPLPRDASRPIGE